VRFVEKMSPVEAIPDLWGAVSALKFERMAVKDGKWKASGEFVTLPAKTVCVAAGTSPNVTYEKEHPGTFELDDRKEFFRPFVAEGAEDGTVTLAPAPKNDGPKGAKGFFTSYLKREWPGKTISYFGDNHPVYAGNVVKAMASAKDGYPHIVRLFEKEIAKLDPRAQAEREARFAKLATTLEEALTARVVEEKRLTPTIVEVIVKAPWAAQKFHPGQFYRLQNFEQLSPVVDGTRLMMEGIALTGAWVDRAKGLLSLIVLEMGGSSRLCATLVPGQPVIVMGPTGAPTEIPKNETVALVGGGLGNAVLFSIAKALKENGCKVLYFGGYKKAEDIFKREEIEASTDLVIWSTDPGGPKIDPRRPQDKSVTGNIVQAIESYANGTLGEPAIPLKDVKRMVVIGSDRMMAAVKIARKSVLAPWLRPDCVAIGSINSPMQCMMKEICAQCLQKHTDPVTGAETVVFSCFNQDQELDRVDFQNLNDRLKANVVLEKLTNAWLDRLLARGIREGVVKLQAVPR
jgi:NAD(P)H-flavin reductase